MFSNQQLEGLTVESTVPVTVTLRAEHADVGSLERVVSGALAEVGRTLWAHLVGQLEVRLARPVDCAASSRPPSSFTQR